MAEQLRAIITPELLHLIVDTIIPYTKTGPIDFAEIRRKFFRGGGGSPPSSYIGEVWPVLVTLSRIGIDNVPDMTTFLPPVSDTDFPCQALGLQLLLDQMPRRLCRGIHHRWTNAYFDTISLRYAKTLITLPHDQQPHSWGRWKNSVSLGYWVIARQWFGTPFVHTDTIPAQEQAIAFTEETRRQVEEITGTTDPYRAQRDAILSDIYGFPRVVGADPFLEDATVQGYTYWMGMLMDVHKPIVDHFGHYPYRNVLVGREDTPEEEEWFRKTEDFARLPREIRDKVKKDIDEGVWTPLPEEYGTQQAGN